MRCPGIRRLKRLAIPMILWVGPQVVSLHAQSLAAKPPSAVQNSASLTPHLLPGSLAVLYPAITRNVAPSPPPCDTIAPADLPSTEAEFAARSPAPCIRPVDLYDRFLDTTTPVRLSSPQKGYLAFHNLIDPGNLVTVLGTSAFTIGTNPHTSYGPGWRGFAANSGVTLLQDATGEFFGTFLIPALTHEDPHYHRLPQASIPKRFIHAVSRTVISQHDDGRLMLNYASLFVYPITAEISNLYVPGIHGNGPSTAARIGIGLATNPAENLITEFLPDLARHVHIRVIFVQRILNGITRDPDTSP